MAINQPISSSKLVSIEPQCLRQFTDPDYQGPKIYIDPVVFQERADKLQLRQGFTPFCHHLICPNFAYLKKSYLRITPENEHLLRTKYDSTTPRDIPVLTRYFPYETVRDNAPQAQFLDVILYDRREIHAVNRACGMEHLNRKDDPPRGIVRVKAQDVDTELPMAPSTMLRNSLGKELGGLEQPLNAERYREAVAFWSKHASIQ